MVMMLSLVKTDPYRCLRMQDGFRLSVIRRETMCNGRRTASCAAF